MGEAREVEREWGLDGRAGGGNWEEKRKGGCNQDALCEKNLLNKKKKK